MPAGPASLIFAKITYMEDTRNVIDKFKGRSEAEIVKELDAVDHGLVIALENTERDFNMGTIVRSANAFGVRQIYVIGRRQWNKRGAMMTDKYLHVHYVGSTAEFVELMRSKSRTIIAIDNIPGSVNMSETSLPKRRTKLSPLSNSARPAPSMSAQQPPWRCIAGCSSMF